MHIHKSCPARTVIKPEFDRTALAAFIADYAERGYADAPALHRALVRRTHADDRDLLLGALDLLQELAREQW